MVVTNNITSRKLVFDPDGLKPPPVCLNPLPYGDEDFENGLFSVLICEHNTDATQPRTRHVIHSTASGETALLHELDEREGHWYWDCPDIDENPPPLSDAMDGVVLLDPCVLDSLSW